MRSAMRRKDGDETQKLPGGKGLGIGDSKTFTDDKASDTMEGDGIHEEVKAAKEKSISGTVSEEDRGRLAGWKDRLDDLYLRYKAVYDNPQYYDQKTGKIHWPKDDGFKKGTKHDKLIKKGTVFKRYGANSGSFLGNISDSFEKRALPPHSKGAEIHYYRLTQDYVMTTGRVAPWFGAKGGGKQFVVYQESEKESEKKMYTIRKLEDLGILEDVTDKVENFIGKYIDKILSREGK